MLEIISILASIALIILVPVQTSQICAGKISPKYKGAPGTYATSFRKQSERLIWLGAVFAVLNGGLIFIESEPGEWIVKLVAALLWLGVALVSFASARKLAALPPPAADSAAAGGV